MIKTIISFLILCSLNLVGQSIIYPTSKLTLNFSSKDFIDSFSNKSTYCYDIDSNSNRLFFINGYDEKVDSLVKNGIIILKLLKSDLGFENFCYSYFYMDSLNKLQLYSRCTDDTIVLNFFPKDSYIFIQNRRASLSTLIIKINNLYKKNIEFSYPFSNRREFNNFCTNWSKEEINKQKLVESKFMILAKKSKIYTKCKECEIVIKHIKNVLDYGEYYDY